MYVIHRWRKKTKHGEITSDTPSTRFTNPSTNGRYREQIDHDKRRNICSLFYKGKASKFINRVRFKKIMNQNKKGKNKNWKEGGGGLVLEVGTDDAAEGLDFEGLLELALTELPLQFVSSLLLLLSIHWIWPGDEEEWFCSFREKGETEL